MLIYSATRLNINFAKNKTKHTPISKDNQSFEEMWQTASVWETHTEWLWKTTQTERRSLSEEELLWRTMQRKKRRRHPQAIRGHCCQIAVGDAHRRAHKSRHTSDPFETRDERLWWNNVCLWWSMFHLEMTAPREAKLEVAEVKMLTLCLGNNRMKKIRNDDIRGSVRWLEGIYEEIKSEKPRQTETSGEKFNERTKGHWGWQVQMLQKF